MRSRLSTNWKSRSIRVSGSLSATRGLGARPRGPVGGFHIGAASQRFVEISARGDVQRQWRDRRVIVGIGEERNGNAVLAGAVGDAVWRRDEAPIGPALHHVGDIDHETA